MDNNVPEEKDYAWKNEQEQILKKWADKALCLKMMHERANRKYWCLNAWFNIPVIIISTLTGTGNFASQSFGSNSETFLFVLGGLNISAGILATIASYTGVAQKVEAHRFSTISWDKFSRKIQIELAKSRNDRVKAKDFINQMADEYDRLIEMSPLLPNDIIRWFSKMIETGEFEEKLGECDNCCFECVCFPFGCSYCSVLACQKENKDLDEFDIAIKESWKQIELPEVIGRIKPTEIAQETIIINIPLKTEVDNLYNIYKYDESTVV